MKKINTALKIIFTNYLPETGMFLSSFTLIAIGVAHYLNK
jgi:hypothetical protein